ncbi:inositol monophosphatase [Halorhabdus sp. CUG00001]|uniref:inositol monophosphatase family protein n=1 Tax=Halorhabdus sp. CUG00001 TaxID=2600297 RepID=UPI00210305D8|nr:inositol monophosphatase [Halorhabdus sp. CUG00001]
MPRADRAAIAREAARAGGAVAMASFRRDLDAETKAGQTDYVTSADREAQRRIAAILSDRFPDEPFVGEENDALGTVPESGPAWIADPIDGTNNYVRGMRQWATSVASVRDGTPIAAATAVPALGDLYVGGPGGVTRNGRPVGVNDTGEVARFTVVPTIWWPRDRREEYARAAEAIVTRFGDLLRVKSVQVSLALLAAGSIEGVLTNVETNPWDTVAGAFLVEQAGGTVTNLDGESWQHDHRGLVASNDHAHDEVLTAARAIDPSTESADSP